jgi:hypothetical protein
VFPHPPVALRLTFEGTFGEKKAFADATAHAPDLSPDLLSQVRRTYDVHPSETYEWLVAISKRVGDDEVVEKAERTSDFAIGARGLSEHFSLTA